MRCLVIGFVIAQSAACAPARPTIEPERRVVEPPKTPVRVSTDATVQEGPVDGSTFPEDEPVFSPPVEVEPADVKERAKVLFREGSIAFSRGDFGGAIAAFTEADRLVPMAALMFNIATARERIGDLGGARNTYAAMLTRPDIDDRLRGAALESIARIDRILSGAPPPK